MERDNDLKNGMPFDVPGGAGCGEVGLVLQPIQILEAFEFFLHLITGLISWKEMSDGSVRVPQFDETEAMYQDLFWSGVEITPFPRQRDEVVLPLPTGRQLQTTSA